MLHHVKRLRLSALLIAGCASHITAASFDCSRAATAQENAICADPSLSLLDEQMTAAYKALLAQLSPSAAAEVRQDQHEWLRWLPQVCPNHPEQPARKITTCLLSEYSEQTASWKDQLKRSGGITFFPRIKVIALADKENSIPGLMRPDFWTARLSWPEIDRPAPQQAAWNAAVRAQVAGWKQLHSAEATVSWELQGANQQFISLGLVNSRYNYGAAHPYEERRSFNWWVALQRPLKAEDVFRPGSGWETLLADRCYAQLMSADRARDLYDGTTVRKAVPDAVKDIGNWSLDARGLTVELPEYSVAPRAAGFLSVLIPWNQLRSRLTPAFDPAALPEPASTTKASP